MRERSFETLRFSTDIMTSERKGRWEQLQIWGGQDSWTSAAATSFPLPLHTNLAADVAKLDVVCRVHQGGHLSLNIELFSVASPP